VVFHFPEIAVVADVVADATLINVGPFHLLFGNILGHLKGLQNRARVPFAAA
jgi:hypothetical protein